MRHTFCSQTKRGNLERASRARNRGVGVAGAAATLQVPPSLDQNKICYLEGSNMANKSGTALAPTRSARERMTVDPFRQVQQRFNRIFGEMFEPLTTWPEENWSLTTWSPACDIYETENEIVVKAELPEVKKDDVHVSFENNLLTIRGERKFSEETKQENYHRVERSYGEFTRSFTLPNFVDTNKINAEFKDGLLRVTMAKREEAKPKQVEIKVK